jgi:hypothetical protein
VAQADLMIDSFGTTQSLTVVGTTSTASSWVSGSDMIGGHRGVQLELATPYKGRDGVDVAMDSSGVLEFTQGSGTGTALLVWDGRDSGSVPDVSATGFVPGKDFSAGDPNAGLAFDVLFNDSPLNLSFTLYNGANPFNYTYSLPGGTASLGSHFIPFSAFSSQLDARDVSAVSLLIDGRVTAGADVTLDNLHCVSTVAPEPSTWLLICLAGLGLGIYRMKK